MTSPTLIADRYELIDDPIRGSMGEVYRAYDTRLDREVAVKIIHRDLLRGDLESELVRRFRREARATARVAHPGVPTVHDVGFHDGRHYVVMELIRGATLADLINESAPVPIGWVAFIAAQISAILSHAHAMSLIHRDLKPDNVMLCADGTVKIIDFGVAVLTDDSRPSHLTPPGTTAGDARYQAPERVLGIATPRSDLYSLGRLLQDLLTGNQDVPPEMRRLIAALIHRQPQRRPASAAEVYQRLEPLVDSLGRLTGFVTETVSRPLAWYMHLAGRLPIPGDTTAGDAAPHSAVPLTAKQARTSAAQYVDAGQSARAVMVLEAAIARLNVTDPAVLDLYRDLAGVLVEGEEWARAAAVCEAAVRLLTERALGEHPAAILLRLMNARAQAALGDPIRAGDLYNSLLRDLPPGDLLSPNALTLRRELAVQVAASGDTKQADTMLTRLLEEMAPFVRLLDAITETRETLARVRARADKAS